MFRPGPAMAGAGAVALLVGVSCTGCRDTSPPMPAAAPSIATEPLPPGWAVEFDWQGPGGPRTFRGFSPTAAFALFPAQSPHPLVAPGAFSATYSARVEADIPGRYRFGVEAEGGQATIAVYMQAADKVADATAGAAGPSFTRWVDLTGPAPQATLTVKFTRAGDGSARLRTWWERQGLGETGFMAEPIPPTAARVPPFATATAAAAVTEQRGRMLIGRLGCTHCHAPPPAPVMGADGHGAHASNPALPHTLAPVLGEVAGRASPEWMRRWILDPQTLAPGSAMPDLFRGDPADGADAEALVHYLVSLSTSATPPAIATDASAVARGRGLFHSVGCVVCHGAADPAAIDPSLPTQVPAAVPPHRLPDLAGKWNQAALRDFLLNPTKLRPQGRMPAMALTASEASDLAAYLIDRHGAAAPVAFSPDAAKVARGRLAYTARGCASCHTLGPSVTGGDPRREPVSTLRPKGIASMRAGAGCLDPSDTRTPRYTLTDHDRRAIEAGLATVRRTSDGGASAPIDAVRLTVDDLGCRLCHETDGFGGPAEDLRPYFRDHAGVELGDEGRFPPRLTGVGWKLNTPWMRDVLTQAGRARPYMTTRMPQFGDPRVMDIAETFAAMEGLFPTSDEPEPAATEDRVLAGRRLVGDTGLNCINCHTVGDLPPVGTPGPDLERATARNRYEWWRRYVQNPARFKGGTRMPSFFATGRGTVTDVYGGDPALQSEAIWAYLSLGGRMPAPAGAVAGDPAERRDGR